MKQIYKLISILVFYSIAYKAKACVNEYRTLLSGEVVYKHYKHGYIRLKDIDKPSLQNKAQELLLAYKRTDSIKYYSDYANALTYLGFYEKAKDIYINIESKHSGLYRTASNLGTVYELLGENKLALQWIKEGIKRNPSSHQHSEWIHVKILEHKLSGLDTTASSVLQLNFGQDVKPSNPKKYDLKKLEKQLRLQLKERLLFIKPPNAIIGNIYFDLGNVLAQTTDIQSALESYQEAKHFGFDSSLMQKRVEAFNKQISTADQRNKIMRFMDRYGNLIWVFVFLVCMGTGILIKFGSRAK